MEDLHEAHESRPAVRRLPLPAVQDGLARYIAAVEGIPPHSREEEQRLARRMRELHDLDAARQLVLANLRHVVAVARGYSGYGLPLPDLIQEGNIGLMKAVKRFDPAAGPRLISFAVFWIRAEIHEYVVRNWSLVKIATTKAQRKLFFKLRSLKNHSGWLTPAEARGVAARLKVPVREVLHMDARLTGGDRSLEAPAGGAEGAPSPGERLVAGGASPEDAVIEGESDDERTAALQRALPLLDARSRDIVEARWLKPGSKAHLVDLAAKHNISTERVRQIQVSAFETLRRAIAAPPG